MGNVCGGPGDSRGAPSKPVEVPKIAKPKKDLETPQPLGKKKTVMFDASTVDKQDNSDEENFEENLRKREELKRKQTYGDTDDAMFLARTDTMHKKNVMTDEKRKEMIMGKRHRAPKPDKAEKDAKEAKLKEQQAKDAEERRLQQEAEKQRLADEERARKVE